MHRVCSSLRVKAGERNELGLKHQENGRGHTGFRQHPPQQLAFLVIQRVQMNDSGCAGPAVVDLILFCRAGFNLPCSFLSPLCLLTALRLPRRSQRESANRGDAQTALRAGLQTPSPSLPASLSGSGCWSVSAAGVHSQGFLGTFHSSSVVSSLRLQCCCPVLLWAGSVHVLGMCVSTLQLCTGSLAASFYQLLSGFLQSVFGLLFNCVVASAAQFYDASLVSSKRQTATRQQSSLQSSSWHLLHESQTESGARSGCRPGYWQGGIVPSLNPR